MLWARQILLTVDLLTPWLSAMVRQLQCVIPAGLVCRVASTILAILSMGYVAFRPRPGAMSHRPPRPSSPKRFRHRITVFRFTESRLAMVHRTLRQRRQARYGSARPLAVECRAPRSTGGVFAAPLRKADTTSPRPG